jgi:hypothetical protein
MVTARLFRIPGLASRQATHRLATGRANIMHFHRGLGIGMICITVVVFCVLTISAFLFEYFALKPFSGAMSGDDIKGDLVQEIAGSQPLLDQFARNVSDGNTPPQVPPALDPFACTPIGKRTVLIDRDPNGNVYLIFTSTTLSDKGIVFQPSGKALIGGIGLRVGTKRPLVGSWFYFEAG